MNIRIDSTKEIIGQQAAREATGLLKKVISEKGFASIILATGASQFGVLKSLVASNEIDWSKVIMFHLDEYINLPSSHPASFRKYLKDRFISRIPELKDKYLINGEAENPAEECQRLGNIIKQYPVDLALVGIGENGHLAFNDPPADFETEEPYIIVELDEACRRQQLEEGWFPSLDDVPNRAISMSIRQIMKSNHIICSVPGKRKADAVKNCFENEISNMHPASILREHSNCTVYLDQESSSLLTHRV